MLKFAIDNIANLIYYTYMTFDWDAVEEWFVSSSGALSYRQVADESASLACFGYQSCSYEKIREKGKEGLWMQKRTEHQAKHHGGIIGDYRRAYEIVTKALTTDIMELSATEMASLGNLQLKYGEAIMALNPPQRDEINVLTRDDVIRIAKEVAEEDIIDLENVNPLDLLFEETPGAEQLASEGAD